MASQLIHTIPCESRNFDEHEEEDITLPHIRILKTSLCPVCNEHHAYGHIHCEHPRTYEVVVEDLKLQVHQ